MKKVLFSIILFLSVAQAWAVDTYNPANGQLTIPLVSVNSTVYQNVVITVGEVIKVNGGIASSIMDTFDPNYGELKISAVKVGENIYNNVNVSVGSVISVGGISNKSGVFIQDYLAKKVWDVWWKKSDPIQILFTNGIRWTKVAFTTLSNQTLAFTPVSKWNALKWENSFWSSLEYSTETLKRAQSTGMRLNALFYLSDTPQDAGQHGNPEAWKNFSLQQTADELNNYCFTTTQYLIVQGLNVEYYEIGNEIETGLLDFSLGIRIPYPNSSIFDDIDYMIKNVWKPESVLLKSAIAGVKRANPNAKIILHIAGLGLSVNDIWVQTFFQTMVNEGVDFDVAGLSMPYKYCNGIGCPTSTVPYYTQKGFQDTIRLLENLNKKINITEYSYPNRPNSMNQPQDTNYPFTPDGQALWVKDFISFISKQPNIIGFNYYDPDYFPGMQHGTANEQESNGLFLNDSEIQPALVEFLNSK